MPPPLLPPQMPLREDGEEESTPLTRRLAAARPIAGLVRLNGLWLGMVLFAAAGMLTLWLQLTPTRIPGLLPRLSVRRTVAPAAAQTLSASSSNPQDRPSDRRSVSVVSVNRGSHVPQSGTDEMHPAAHLSPATSVSSQATIIPAATAFRPSNDPRGGNGMGGVDGLSPPASRAIAALPLVRPATGMDAADATLGGLLNPSALCTLVNAEMQGGRLSGPTYSSVAFGAITTANFSSLPLVASTSSLVLASVGATPDLRTPDLSKRLRRQVDPIPPPHLDISIDIDPNYPQGVDTTHTGTISLQSTWGFQANIALSIPYSPPGISITLNQYLFNLHENAQTGQIPDGNAIVTVSVSASVAPGVYTIPINVGITNYSGPPNPTVDAASITVVVPGQTGYDFTIQADPSSVVIRKDSRGYGSTVVKINGYANNPQNSLLGVKLNGVLQHDSFGGTPLPGMQPTSFQRSFVDAPNQSPQVIPITLTVDPTTPPGTALLAITGSSGNISKMLYVPIEVRAEELTVTASPRRKTIDRGDGSGTVSVSVSPVLPTTLSVLNLPDSAHVGWSFSPNPTNTDGTPSTLTFTVAANAPGKTYSLTVQGTSGTSVGTDLLELTIRIPAPSNAPSNLRAVAQSHRQINLTWSDTNPEKDGFRIERRVTGSGDTAWTEIGRVLSNVTSYADTGGLQPNTSYEYRIFAFTNGGDSPASNLAAARTFPAPASNVGTDFWLAIPAGVHRADGTAYKNVGSGVTGTQPEYFLTVTAQPQAAADVTVTLPRLGITLTTVHLAAGTSQKIPLTDQVLVATLDNAAAPANNGMRVQSTAPISVSAMYHTWGGSEAFLCLPVQALGTEYIALDHDILGLTGRFNSSAFLTVVATQDGTTVRITPSQNAGGTPGQRRGAQVAYTVTLDAGQVYQLQRDVSQNDSRHNAPHFPGLTGTIVTSDKPVSVITGADNSGVGTPSYFSFSGADINWGAYANPLIEELPPVDRWGTDFVTMPPVVKHGPQTNGIYPDVFWGFSAETWTLSAGYRIVAAFDGTWVRVNGRLLATLNRGEYVDYQANDGRDILFSGNGTTDGITRTPWRITANQPVLVAEYGQGNDRYGSPPASQHGPGSADVRPKVIEPYMTLVPAVDQWDAGFFTATLNPFMPPASDPNGRYYGWFVNHQSFSLVGTPAALSDIQVDGQALDLSRAVPADDGTYFGVTVHVQPGPHSLVSPGNQVFGGVQYGLDDGSDAYGLPAGYILPWHERPAENQPPLIKLDSPVLDQRFLAGTGVSVPIHARVTVDDPDGSVTRVDYQLFWGNYPLIDRTLVAEQSVPWTSGATNCPFDYTIPPDLVNTTTGGNFRLRATVYDDQGGASSAWTQFHILSPDNNRAPQVTITAPIATPLTNDVSAVRFGPGGAVSFTAAADVTDDDNNLSEVKFELLQNDQAVQTYTPSATAGSSSYSAQFANVAVGTYDLRVTGKDNLNKATSQDILVFVLGPETVTPQPIRINCGDGPYSGTSGDWSADAGFIGGVKKSFTGTVSSTTEAPLYNDQREAIPDNGQPYGVGHFTYAFAVRPNAKATVLLHYAERVATQAGRRKFDVVVNNVAAASEGEGSVEGMDIYALAGANAAYTQEIDNVRADANGYITLGFFDTPYAPGEDPVGTRPYHAMVSAIEVLPDSGTLTCDNSSTNGALSASNEIMTMPGSGGSNGSNGNSPVNFLTEDAITSGDWTDGQVRKYGTQGYKFFTNDNSLTQLPSYVSSVTGSNANWFVWGTFTDPRFLRTPPGTNPQDRRLACWYNATGTQFEVPVNFSDTETHQVALYMVDVNHENLAQTIAVIDTASGVAQDTRTVSGFSGGKYLVWTVRGNVTFRVTSTVSGKSAELMALFFDPAPSVHTATFVGADDQTRGDWATQADGRKYGTDGYACLSVATYDTLLPSYVSAVSNLGTPNGSGGYINTPGAFFWGTFTEQRFLRTPPGNDPNDRRLARWHGNPRFDVPVTFTDTLPHQVSLYMVDVNNEGLSQTIEVINPVTGQTLDSQVASNFYWGRYLTWTVRGNVTFRVTNINTPTTKYAELMALFFDPGPPLNTVGGGYYAKRYNIDARSGKTLTATMTKTGTGSSFQPYLYLLAPEGYVVKTSNRNATQVSLTYQCQRTGTYTLVATSDPDYPMTTGTYSVSLNCNANNTNPPVAPADLAARPVADPRTAHMTSVELSWRDNSPDETGFDVYRRDSTTGDWGQPIASVGPNATASVTWRDTVGVQEDHVYDYKVVTNRDGVQSSPSNDAVASTYLIPPS